MYQHFELAFLLQKPKQQSHRNADPFALEPWDKNTLEIEIRQLGQNNCRTFYQTPLRPMADIAYSTQRVFTSKDKRFRTSKSSGQTRRQSQEGKTSMVLTNQSAVSHYNINGNIIPQAAPEKKKFSNQFHLRMRQKHHQAKVQLEDAALGVSSLSEIKKRVDCKKDSSCKTDSLYIRFNSERDHDSPEVKPSSLKDNRKNKVISLGFRKFSCQPLPKRGLNLSCFPFM